MLDKLIALAKVEVKIEIDPARLRPSDVEVLIGDASKFRADTGWEPRIPFDQTLARSARLLASAHRPRAARSSRGLVRARERHPSHPRHRGDRLRGAAARRDLLARRAPGRGLAIDPEALPSRVRAFHGRHSRRGSARSVVRAVAPDAIVHLAGALARRRVVAQDSGTTSASMCWAPRTCWLRRAPVRWCSVERRGLRHWFPRRSSRSRSCVRGDPRTPYALTKAAAERLALASGPRWCAFLQPDGAGPGIRTSPCPPSRRSSRRSRPARLPVLSVGNLSARRDFVHVDDGAEALARLAENGAAGRGLQLASGSRYSIAEALDRLIAVSRSRRTSVEEDPEKLRPVDLPLLR